MDALCSSRLVWNLNPAESTIGGGGVFRQQEAAAAALIRPPLLRVHSNDNKPPLLRVHSNDNKPPPLLVHLNDNNQRGVAVVRAGAGAGAYNNEASSRLEVDAVCRKVEMLLANSKSEDEHDQLDFDFYEHFFFQSEVPLDEYHILGRHLLVIGLVYQKEHPRALRGLQFPCARMPEVVFELSSLLHVDEAAFISRRSRFEIYAVVLDPINALEELCAWMAKESGIPLKKLRFCCYWHFGRDAWRHLFEVTSGLRNLLPEGRNLRQVRKIADSLDGFRGFGKILTTLFEHAISVGERVRSEMKLQKTDSSVSLASTAVDLALKMHQEACLMAEHSFFGPRPQSKANPQILVVGSGRMGMLVIKYLVVKGYKTITLVHELLYDLGSLNYSMRCREELILDQCEEEGAEVIHKPWPDLASCIAEADIVFSCREMCDNNPFILKKDLFCDDPEYPTVPTHLKVLVDTSIPHSVEEDSASHLSFACLYNLDDIEEAIVREKRNEEGGIIMERVRGHIDEEAGKFESFFNTIGAVHILQSLRGLLKLKYARELEERRPPHILGSDPLWKREVNSISRFRADRYISNFTAQLGEVLGSCFINLVDSNGYPWKQHKNSGDRDDEEE